MEKEQAEKIRGLIADLRLYHHKAQRHVELIVQAIGEGRTTKGYLGREAQKLHPATWMWENAVLILEGWLSGNTAGKDKLNVGRHAGWILIGALEDRTRIKQWQVERVVAKLKAASRMYPGCEYFPIVTHPEKYEDFAGYREPTLATIIHDTVDGQPAELSLAQAIDHLEPANWNFPENLLLALRAINGNLRPHEPFAVAERNLRLNPIAQRMRVTAATLREFCGRPAGGPIDRAMLGVLGKRTHEKTALAALLEAKITDGFGTAGPRATP
jgi:hypothetical protein